MPACSTCGLAVDWLRGCYTSQWQLFADDPTIRTAGRYYFAPPGTSFVAGTHHLGSRRWHDKNWQHEVVLGECLDTPQPWDAGLPPAAMPFARVVGSLECIARGETTENAIDPDELVDGFPAACFMGQDDRNEDWERLTAFNRCTVQRFYAKVILSLYADDETQIAEDFSAALEGFGVVTVHPSRNFMPSVCTVINPNYSIAVLDGTRSYQQGALQALTAIQRPTDRGPFGTVPLWWDASQWVHDHLTNDGANAEKPIFLVGHSYGGATALVLAGRYKNARPERDIRFLTYGSPKPGDSRLSIKLRQLVGINLANDDDLITVFPPDEETLHPVAVWLDLPHLAVWTEWERPPRQVRQDFDGTLTPNDLVRPDFATLLSIVNKVVDHHRLEPFSGHPIREYLRRIEMRCPGRGWPMGEEVDVVLKQTPEYFWTKFGMQVIDPTPILPIKVGGMQFGTEAVRPLRQPEVGFRTGGTVIDPQASQPLGMSFGMTVIDPVAPIEEGFTIGGEAS